jgi:hypothetical protein
VGEASSAAKMTHDAETTAMVAFILSLAMILS